LKICIDLKKFYLHAMLNSPDFDSKNLGFSNVSIAWDDDNHMDTNMLSFDEHVSNSSPLPPFLSASFGHPLLEEPASAYPNTTLLKTEAVFGCSTKKEEMPPLVDDSKEQSTPSVDDDGGKKRKIRWRPSPEQKAILDFAWQNDQYPGPDDKKVLMKRLGGAVTYHQITSWFKHRREHDSAKGKFTFKYAPTTKFQPEQLQVLEKTFESEPYAKAHTVRHIAAQLGVNIGRVQNWFKHKRSRLARQGKFDYKCKVSRRSSLTHIDEFVDDTPVSTPQSQYSLPTPHSSVPTPQQGTPDATNGVPDVFLLPDNLTATEDSVRLFSSTSPVLLCGSPFNFTNCFSNDMIN
jgi:hypothetical protein